MKAELVSELVVLFLPFLRVGGGLALDRGKGARALG